jgi:DNA-binding LacI/PurR family transcriptional regulator
MTEVRRRVTALDVARAAGVSKTTVSYVLNDTPRQSIPHETRQRVLDAVNRLNYTPLSAARALRRGHNDTVLLVMPDWPLGRVLALILDSLATELEQRGLSLLIRRQRPGQPLAAMWRELAPAAIVALGDLDEEDQRAICDAGMFVATALLTSPPSPQNTVVIPQALIGAVQTQHLVSRGHRHLGYAGPGEARFRAFRDLRVEGARQTCHELGLPELDVLDMEPTLEGAVAALQHWRSRTPRVSGILAYNDEFGGALLAGLRELDLSAPDDFAIIGVDNEPLTRFTSPALTTVDQNHEAVAAHLTQVVASGMAGEPAPTFPVDEALSLVVRAST